MRTTYCKRCEDRVPVGINTMRWRHETIQIVECHVCGAAVNVTGWVRIRAEELSESVKLTNKFLVFFLRFSRIRFFFNAVMKFFGIILCPIEESDSEEVEEFVDSVVAQISSYTGESWDGVENPVIFIDRTMKAHRANIQG